ncbi:tail assembly chaperone E/41/14-like protein [Pseudomonas sp. SJZ080]|uniref:phage tail assembly protein n=1 Tax=Pseudomonas sp. SJZ080 TaxID=2572888 RepID=UPI0011997133|nr:phage tail assembly protein [Pseudomonas sp. SJZ080]TWC57608.1 tail assembly chaperone E/41/14-like protein [Pseudomonas sp. SJZ080]
MEKTEFKLAAPIQAHGEEVSVLNIRRPTVAEIRALKVLPYTLGETMLPVLDMEAACKYLAICAAIPASSVNQLELSDLNTLAWQVVGFFMPSNTEAPTT